MKLIDLYTPFIGKRSDFLKPFEENEDLQQLARQYWNHLDNQAIRFFLAMLAIAALGSYLYYGPFNNLPGRHYRMKYWWMFFAGVVILTALATWLLVDSVSPQVEGSGSMEFRLSLANVLYGAVVYFLLSCLWCKCLPTNAYRFI